MRITKITIKDYLGFPGTYSFDLEGRPNLLIHGENGAGKSSLYHSLNDFFESSQRALRATAKRNLFTVPEEPELTIHIEGHDATGALLPDSGAYSWNATDSPLGKDVFERAAKTRGFLDYRALLQTHFLQWKKKQVDIFPLLMETVLRDHANPITNRKFSEEWSEIKDLFRWLGKNKRARLTKAVDDFNNGLENVLAEMETEAGDIMAEFGRGATVTLNLEPHAQFIPTPKQLVTPKVLPIISYGGIQLPSHHRVLNEERLSAIAIALYLAALKINPPSELQVLVLDDILIGLDMGNRIPLLKVLEEKFADRQVFLFTHDKVWFDFVRWNTESSEQWNYMELRAMADPVQGFDRPVATSLLPNKALWNLSMARYHLGLCGLDQNGALDAAKHGSTVIDVHAATVNARIAFELKLKKYCKDERVPFAYSPHPDDYKLDTLWTNAIKHARMKLASNTAKLAALESEIAALEAHRRVVLNPYSHSASVTLNTSEVVDAVEAVRKLKLAR